MRNQQICTTFPKESQMDRMRRWVACVLVVVAPVFTPSVPCGQSAQMAYATFINQHGHQLGTATLTQTPHGVLITADLSGVPPGEHGFHIHETGRCDPPSFESAGAHYALRGQQHGYLGAGGAHAGDLPNQFVGQDGRLRTHVFTPSVTLRAGQATLFDADGSALVVHAKADDYRSQPAGEAGGRLACAVIQRE
jgi:Cu-Zn family superoxide dismutase